jgi:apolipoprotein N-acyltransferase
MVTVIVSGFLASAAFEPIGLWFFAIIGFALFLRKLSSTSYPIVSSFLFGLALNGLVLHWSSKFVGSIPWVFLSLLQALFYIPVGYIFKKTRSLKIAILALLLMEELRSRFPFGGFGWTRIAFSQVDSVFAPVVKYGGVLALSFITLLIAYLLVRIRFGNILLIAALFLAGTLIPTAATAEESIKLLAIQGNTPQVGLQFNDRAMAVFELHRDATRKYSQKTYNAIIWPENAIDIDPQNYPSVAQDLIELTKEVKSPIIAGVVLNRGSGPENASIKYGLNGLEESVYIKQFLTPFGEYMPLRWLAEIVSPFAKSVNDFSAGAALVVHDISGHQIAPVICYELINDGLVRTAALNSKALIVQTNSATFAGTPESAQQLAITRLRAIEHSRSILSVSTIGISALIDSNGVVLERTEENVAAALEVDLALSTETTIADKLGGLAPLIVLLLALIWAISGKKKEWESK